MLGSGCYLWARKYDGKTQGEGEDELNKAALGWQLEKSG